jgi:hypothetical protein
MDWGVTPVDCKREPMRKACDMTELVTPLRDFRIGLAVAALIVLA